MGFLQARRTLRLSLLAFPLALASLPEAAIAQYTESFQSWSATSAATWQTKSLSGSPFNVPANAVVEIAIRNSNSSSARDGGVRAVGSSLDRKLQFQKATGGGTDVMVMHVQTNSSSQIQHYAQNTSDVDFVLLGYWGCGTYVERFDSFHGTTAWTDQDLSGYGVSANNIVEFLVSNDGSSNNNPYDAGVRTNGSSIDRRLTFSSPSQGIDQTTMLVKADNTGTATIETYAGHVTKITFYLIGYWSVAPGSYTEKFTDLGGPSTDATWEDIDLTASGVVDGGIAEIILANSVTTEPNNMGVRTNGSSLSRFLNIREVGNGAADWGRMHVLSDGAADIEFYQQRVSDTHHFYLMGYWDGAVIMSDATTGQVADAFHEQGGETNAELYAFKLSPCAGSLTVSQLVFRLTSISGLVNGDWAGIEILIDANSDGHIGVGESTSVGGAGVVNQAAGTITFSTSFTVSATTQYILRADFASLSFGDRVTIGLAAADVTGTDPVTGSTTSVTHKEQLDCYVESFQAWSATSTATWETKSLSGSPFSVPASAVVEIAIRNAKTSNSRYGGARAVGSSLERRLQINQATGGGVDVLVMHVQTDSSSQIQHYAENTTDVDFVLLGYWKCGTYVEGFDSFTIANNTTWTDTNLCSYGVGQGHIAEIVMTNSDTGNESEAGVRTNGSALSRKLNIHQASGGGVDTATMFVEADTSTGSTIEAYAQDKTKVTFYHVGHWSVAPLAYTEQFTDVGSPSSSATWEDLGLATNGVGNTSHVEIVLANEDTGNERNMGIRENGSALSRFLNIQEAQGGGADFARMHIATDVTATIEFYHSNIASSNSFFLVGKWDSCTTSSNYVITDLGAITSSKSSLADNVNSSGNFAGWEEDASGNPTAWYLSCGTFTALGTLGGSYAEAHGINNSGMIAGWSHNASGKRRAFKWTSGGGMTDLGVVSSRTDSEALSVNNNSEIVGTVDNFGRPPSNRLAFIYLPVAAYGLGTGMSSLGTLGGTQSVAIKINDSGQVAGGAQNGSGNFRPFRWANGTMTDLGTLGGESTVVDHRGEAINSSGKVAGRSYTSGGSKHAFYWDGSMTDLGVLTGGTESWAFGLNASAVVVGTSNVTGGAFHAFVWDSVNGMRDLNNLITGGSGWTLTRATDIGSDGSIVGWGTNGSGNVRAFLLTPTCSAGGGAASVASAVIASGTGTTSSDGSFDQTIVDQSGDIVGTVSVLTSEPGSRIDYAVSRPTGAVVSGDPTTILSRPGFADGIALPRTIKIDTTSDSQDSVLVVSLRFALGEIATLNVDAGELELHVFDHGADHGAGVWLPAGRSIGNALPSTVIGQSGVASHDDGTVEYWCVRDSGGTFAVGKPVAVDGGATAPHPAPRACGVAMISMCVLSSIAMALHRRRR
ncbi:MAG: hypothetical protein HY287_03000 [Planctomycetes bacterium]|nr:hypothetical protein [Planctomycetota bacterium]